MNRQAVGWISAAVVLAAAILLFPFPTRVVIQGGAVEYSPTDAVVAIPHEVSIDGRYYFSILGRDRFRGTFYVSGIDGLGRAEGNAAFSFEPGDRYYPAFLDDYGQPNSGGIAALLFDRNFGRLAIQLPYKYQGEDSDFTASGDGVPNFILIGAGNREEAVAGYAELLEEKLP